ncbi:MAG: heavy-metal-associated domain-containing protein [Bacteroidales bacterium]|nr:heavy-metal-associated domain-containing protein [Bacteroidales bacterium]MBQ9310026.1 heavy-metal-associated domain-containing protein [Bacteroidales bacterium]
MKKFIIITVLTLLGAAFYSAIAAKPKAKTETVTYVVNMHCQNCVNKITDKISFLKGVEDLKVSLKDKTVTVKFNPAKVQEKTFMETIEKLGYTATKRESKNVGS